MVWTSWARSIRVDRDRAVDFIRLDRRSSIAVPAADAQPDSAATGPLPSAHDLRGRPGEIDHRRRLDAARAAVEHQVDVVLEAPPDLVRIGERQLVAGQRERRRQQRLAERGEQRLRDRMVGNPQPDRLAARVEEAPRQLARRLQDERVAARRERSEQTVAGVVDARVGAELREVAAHQREVVALVDAADAAQALASRPCRPDARRAHSRSRSGTRSRRRRGRSPPRGRRGAARDARD